MGRQGDTRKETEARRPQEGDRREEEGEKKIRQTKGDRCKKERRGRKREKKGEGRNASNLRPTRSARVSDCLLVRVSWMIRNPLLMRRRQAEKDV